VHFHIKILGNFSNNASVQHRFEAFCIVYAQINDGTLNIGSSPCPAMYAEKAHPINFGQLVPRSRRQGSAMVRLLSIAPGAHAQESADEARVDSIAAWTCGPMGLCC
jgi:hypothetical protein